MKKQKRPKLLKDAILKHIRNNSKDYIILLLIFIIGLIIGVMIINYTGIEQKEQISTYINTFVEGLKTNKAIDRVGLFRDSIIKNIGLAVVMWLVGMAVTLVPVIYAIVLFRGFSLGYTISSIIGTLGIGKGILFSISALLLQNILIIPATLGLAISGIRLYKSIIKDRRRESIKIEILRTYIICCINAGNTCNIFICRNLYINKFTFMGFKLCIKKLKKK